MEKALGFDIDIYLLNLYLGVAIDGGNNGDSSPRPIRIIKRRGKVKALEEEISFAGMSAEIFYPIFTEYPEICYLIFFRILSFGVHQFIH